MPNSWLMDKGGIKARGEKSRPARRMYEIRPNGDA
jgi:hypothetical protein